MRCAVAVIILLLSGWVILAGQEILRRPHRSQNNGEEMMLLSHPTNICKYDAFHHHLKYHRRCRIMVEEVPPLVCHNMFYFQNN